MGGNSRTSIIKTITPTELEQSRSTLQFATRAKKITQKAKINQAASENGLIQQLRERIKTLNCEVAQLRQVFINQRVDNLKPRTRCNTWCQPPKQSVSSGKPRKPSFYIEGPIFLPNIANQGQGAEDSNTSLERLNSTLTDPFSSQRLLQSRCQTGNAVTVRTSCLLHLLLEVWILDVRINAAGVFSSRMRRIV